jgi:hypothetical protein
MPTPANLRSLLLTCGLALTVAGCDSTSDHTPLTPSTQVTPVTPGQEWAPVLDPADFVPGGANPFFPLVPGTTLNYEADTEDGLELGLVEVTSDVKTILGINVVVVHDRVYLDANGNGLADGTPCSPAAPGFTSELIEDTFDWFKTQNDGTVWYLGEDSKEYEDCVLVGTAGSWEAGVNDAFPGIVMLANPVIGQSYRQEFAEDIAEDWARVMSLDQSVSVKYGDFTGCLETMDWTYLEPGSREHKFYCPGVGLTLEIRPSGGQVMNELVAKTP